MTGSLVLTAEQARNVIYNSEGRRGVNGASAGHTIERHINISRAGLASRMEETDPQGRYNGTVFWRAAFLDINSAAERLAETLTVMAAEAFVANFSSQPDGAQLPNPRPVMLHAPFDARDQRGRFPVQHVRIALQKMRSRPHQLHLITFYPSLPEF